MGGLLSGLLSGTILDFIFKTDIFWAIFFVFGFETGFIFYQREELKKLRKGCGIIRR